MSEFVEIGVVFIKPVVAFPFRHHGSLVCPEAKRMLEEAGFELVCNDTGEKLSVEDQKMLIKDAFGIVAGTEKYDAEMIAAAKNCRVIIRFGVGLDNFDLVTMRERGIQVGVIENHNAVAEFALTLMLSAMKHLPQYDAVVRQGLWSRFSMYELRGKTVGIVGFGRIGMRLAELLKAFNTNVIVYDPYVSEETAKQRGVTKVELDYLLRESDVVTLHVPSTPQTKHLINADTIARMKQGAVLVNTSRGELVDEAALYDALKSGKIGAASLDVYEMEPVKKDNPLFELENITLAPHVAALTKETNYNAGIICAKSIIDTYNGGTPMYPVR